MSETTHDDGGSDADRETPSTLINTDWDDLPFASDETGGLGWLYKDEPHGGFLVVAETEAQFHDEEADEEVEARLGVCVEFIDWGASVPDGDGYLAVPQLVPHPESLSDSSLRKVTPGGMDTDEIGYMDVSSYGYSVKINDHHADNWQDAYEAARGGLGLADMGSGFVLDRRINRAGATGWDMLRDAVLDINMHHAAMNRRRKRRGD